MVLDLFCKDTKKIQKRYNFSLLYDNFLGTPIYQLKFQVKDGTTEKR